MRTAASGVISACLLVRTCPNNSACPARGVPAPPTASTGSTKTNCAANVALPCTAPAASSATLAADPPAHLGTDPTSGTALSLACSRRKAQPPACAVKSITACDADQTRSCVHRARAPFRSHRHNLPVKHGHGEPLKTERPLAVTELTWCPAEPTREHVLPGMSVSEIFCSRAGTASR